MTDTALLYARVSDDHDGTSTSPESQLEACRQAATERGYLVVDEYVDRDISGWSGARRPGFERLLRELGRAQVVLAFEYSRLTRNERDALRLSLASLEAGVRVETVTDHVEPDSELAPVLRALSLVKAKGESQAISNRVKRFNADRAKAGLPHPPGARAYGYTRDFEIVADERDVILEAKARVLGGESLTAVCNNFNDRGITTTRGKQWRATTLKRMLTGVHLIGKRKHLDRTYEGAWDPILTDADHRRLVARLNDPSRRTRGAVGEPYLLTGGLLRCGLCGQPMLSRARSGGRRAYGCRRDAGARQTSCGRLSIVAEPLEELVSEALLASLDREALDAAIAATSGEDDDLQEAMEDLDALRARLDELTRARFVEGLLGDAEYRSARTELDGRIERRERQVRTLTGATRAAAFDGLRELRARWEDASTPMGWRRELMGLFIDHIEVGPALVKGRKSFDPDRVSISWRV